MQRLSAILEFPQHAYPCIHIAGSNGKGSVATKIARALEAAGLRVGLYTSPHLFSFCERIVINSQPISEIEAEEGLSKLLSLPHNATFFELATLLAFEIFRENRVDVAVIETGLGGRYDATNVIEPFLSVITSISKEHAHLLGEDLEAIAFEKAGILKKNVPVVLGPHARQKVFYKEAARLDCPLYEVIHSFPFYDEENQAIAEKSLTLLIERFGLTQEQINEGLQALPPCRLEQHGRILFDVAHNPDAFARLVQAVSHRFPGRKIRYLIGLCRDKEIGACLGIVSQAATHIHFVQASNPRAATTSELAAALQHKIPYTCHEEVNSALIHALDQAELADELLVVAGSFYIMPRVKTPQPLFDERDLPRS